MNYARFAELIRQLGTFSGFLARVSEHSRGTKTRKEAYELTEAEYVEYFGTRRYSDYNSFMVSSNYHHKKRKQQT